MAQRRKKLVLLEAVQFRAEQKPWPEGVTLSHVADEEGALHPRAVIHTPDGIQGVSEGDWIITGVTGEKYLRKDETVYLAHDEAK